MYEFFIAWHLKFETDFFLLKFCGEKLKFQLFLLDPYGELPDPNLDPYGEFPDPGSASV